MLKINYLISNNIPLINEKGILNEIFYINMSTLKQKYGLTIEELISEYSVRVKENSR